jgi:hypothetical protein
MKTIEEFKLLCTMRNIPYTSTPNPYHFKLIVRGTTVNIWPTADKYAMDSQPVLKGAEDFLRNAFPEIQSYLSPYILRNPDGTYFFVNCDGSHSIPYPNREECLFEFGKYCYQLEQRGVATPSAGTPS